MRRPIRPLAVAAIALALVAAACSSPGGPPGPTEAAGAELWRTTTLQDVTTGEGFSVADLRGKVVVLEMMAVWCSNCRIQQHEAKAALAQLGSDNVVYVSVDVDPRERAEDLAAYAAQEGFGWRFVVASPDVARSLAASFGPQVLSPPSTPTVTIDPEGNVAEHHFGIRRADELAGVIGAHLP